MRRVRVSRSRAAEVSRVLHDTRRWATSHEGVKALALVGSWAREDAYDDSDVDLVVLATSPEVQLAERGWEAMLSGAIQAETVSRGVLTECRYVLPSGLEVEIGVTSPTWASTQPLDAGTARVAEDGLQPIHDPEGLLSTLMQAVSQASVPPSSS